MNDDLRNVVVGVGGFFMALTVEQFNHYAAACVAVLTIAALIPLCVERWKKFRDDASKK